MSNACGTIKTDDKTLFWVGNVLTTSEAEPKHLVKAPCGAFWLDGDVFKAVDGVITRASATEVTEPTMLCGMVELDSAVFAKNGLEYSLIPLPPTPDPDKDDKGDEDDNSGETS